MTDEFGFSCVRTWKTLTKTSLSTAMVVSSSVPTSTRFTTESRTKRGKEELVRDIRVYAVSLLRVLNAEILPFDHARNARKLTEYVESYDDDAGEQFDFEPTLTELRALASEIDAFQEAAHDGRIDPAVANDAITSRSRVLTRLNLVQRGQFEQDPAVSREPVPRLAPARKFPILEGNDIEFLQVQLKRRQNAVVQELPEAHEVIPDIDA
jgi:hypothetical protein